MQCIPLVFSRNQVVRLSFTLSLESMNDGVGMRHAVFKPAVLSHSYKQDCYRDNLNISSTTLSKRVPTTNNNQWSGQCSRTALIIYGRLYLQTGCVYTRCKQRACKNKNFLLPTSTRHILGTKVSIDNVAIGK